MSSFPSQQALVPSLLASSKATANAWKIFLVLAGTVLIAVAARVQLPFSPIPATMQTLVIFAMAAAYGRNLAVATVLVYLAQGAAGLPVFAGGGGIAYFAGPTAGYLAGFVVAAAITGAAADRGWAGNPFKLFGANLIGEAAILLLGAAWLAVAFGVEKAFVWGIGPFIITDLVKIALASAIVPALAVLVGRLR